MEFKENQAIYLQIVSYMSEKILKKEIAEGDRLPSIRESSVNLVVNPSTVQRAYDFLEQEKIIENKRGIGFFATSDARSKTLNLMKKQFVEEDLKTFFKSIQLLEISWEFVKQEFEIYKTKK